MVALQISDLRSYTRFNHEISDSSHVRCHDCILVLGHRCSQPPATIWKALGLRPR